LLEVLLAVAIFALGLLGLGRATGDMMKLNILRLEDERLRKALESYVEEIYMRPDLQLNSQTIELEGGFAGVNIAQVVEPLEMKTEEGAALNGLFKIILKASEPKTGSDYEKTLTIYVRR
jgi:type II secretory pathway component PulJ